MFDWLKDWFEARDREKATRNWWEPLRAAASPLQAASTIYDEPKFDGRVFNQAEFIAYCRELRAKDALLPVQRVIVHHSATAESSYASQSLAQVLRNWWNYYRRTKGWSGAPHGVIMSRDPGIGILNSLLYDGIHCSGGNTNSRGVEIMGNFTSVLPSGILLENAVVWVAGVLYAGKMDMSHLRYHRQYGGTACPGAKLIANWSWFCGLVEAKLNELWELDKEPEPENPEKEEPVNVGAILSALSIVARLSGAVDQSIEIADKTAEFVEGLADSVATAKNELVVAREELDEAKAELEALLPEDGDEGE